MPALDWKEIQNEATIVDLHIHPAMQQQLFQRNLNVRYVINRTLHGNPMSVRASFPRLKDGGYDVFFSTLYAPEKGLQQDFPIIKIFRLLRPDLWAKLIVAPSYNAILRMIGDMETAVNDSRSYDLVRMAHSVSDLDAILGQPKGKRPIAVIHAVEGGHSLDAGKPGDEEVLDRVEELFKRGVICLTLAHFYPNRVAHPCYPWPEDIVHLSARPETWRDLTHGLTDVGVQVVEKMIELGMLIDISHCTPTARRQIYAIVDASGTHMPLMATHVGAYAINPSPYNLEDWEIERVARDGGVMGVIFMPYWLMPNPSGQGINAISRHIQYLFKVGGERAPGIGTDFDGFTTPPDDLDNASLMFRLTQRLVVDGYNRDQIKNILGENALRAIRAGWGKKT